jgi:hypothetical protein
MIRVSENDQGQRRISARIIRVRDAFPDATRGKHSSLPGNASLTLIIPPAVNTHRCPEMRL